MRVTARRVLTGSDSDGSSRPDLSVNPLDLRQNFTVSYDRLLTVSSPTRTPASAFFLHNCTKFLSLHSPPFSLSCLLSSTRLPLHFLSLSFRLALPFPLPFLFPSFPLREIQPGGLGGALLAPPAGSGAWHRIAVNVTLHERTVRSAQIRTTELRILCRTALSLRQTAVHRAPVRATPNYDSSNTLFILNRFLTLFSLSGTPANLH